MRCHISPLQFDLSRIEEILLTNGKTGMIIKFLDIVFTMKFEAKLAEHRFLVVNLDCIHFKIEHSRG
jgi:hypothetical protein